MRLAVLYVTSKWIIVLLSAGQRESLALSISLPGRDTTSEMKSNSRFGRRRLIAEQETISTNQIRTSLTLILIFSSAVIFALPGSGEFCH